ncbi:C3 and PZP-like alpha-2-macroglobulin domain-containing protein 8 [Acromyrmex echinatior]|uniref:C3 and PZP-like alpha-2-macroglobulin domain-containing protein 8 n=1 Tax=Acromyrmex echinatior TaxID=103372 RepID=F4X8I0_ACREC|nr:C3 and PZP-like alpha-2-macroglobulin domain-containing protein 8 [Acromyrmex echinatior]
METRSHAQRSDESLNTEDKLEYHFYPVTAGQIQFRIKAPNDAHVALTTGPQEGDPMYEIFIGGWNNSKSVVRKNRAKPEVAETETPGILSADDYRGFWIRWDNGVLTVGKEGESNPFLSYADPEPFGIGYFGVCTGWGATGEWLIEAICCGGGYGRKPLNTPNKLQYKFHAVRSGSVLIDVKAMSNGHIALTDRKGESSPMYEIMLGGWENKTSVIRYDRKQPDKVRVDTPNLLTDREHKRFSITWLEGLITVRSGGPSGAVLMEWRDPNPIGVSYVGVRTGWGATGNWKLRFEHYPAVATAQKKYPSTTPSAPAEVRGLDAGSVSWCDASGGMIPPDAVEGGQDEEPLFVGRAHHEGALIPGKVKPGHSVCYVAWGGAEHGKTDYQVLCGCKPTWVPVSGGTIPPNAIPGGETEDGEPLFVGRVHHEGTVTIGKVQPSHNVCYIPYAGSEIASSEYEIMVGQ